MYARTEWAASAPTTGLAPSNNASDALAWLLGEATTTERNALQAVQAYSDRHDPAWAFGDQAGSHTNRAVARLANEKT
ncbi:hypothetical protein [Micromonospora sp. KC606]|uniref:hypothetical protein n=1 Tax=Micromonospora sp. KC606 TaxID=2530379 RepID=UPI001FB8177B|nr:hypothetical protein [Micromonospora sp. KC606]